MLQPLTDRQQIALAQEELVESFSKGATRYTREIGFQGGNVSAEVFWHPIHGIWGSLNKTPVGDEESWQRYWNAFGIEDPPSTKSLSITCEANPAHEGIDKRVAGLFARGLDDKTYLLHNGRIGGGRVGIGQKLFWEHWPYRAASVASGKTSLQYAVVAELGSPQASFEIARFVKEVERIKGLATGD